MRRVNGQPRVLILPSFYSDPEKPVLGIFFAEQAHALAKSGLSVSLIYVEPRKLRAFSAKSLVESHWQVSQRFENGVLTLRQHGWNTLVHQSTAGGLFWAWATSRLINRYVRMHGKPDLIHAHNIYWAGYAAYLAFRQNNIPYVITEHSSSFLLNQVSSRDQKIAEPVVRNAEKLFSVSQALKDSIGNFFPGKTLTVQPNCVDIAFFTMPQRERHSRPFIFLALAQLSDNKGFDVLIRAFAAAFKGNFDFILKLGGGGPIRNKLEFLSRSLGIEKQVVFLGALSQEQVRDAMWGANAFVLSSHRETFGVVLIEAMATGLPVIATRSGGPQDIVSPGVGFLAKPGDVADLALVMTRAATERFSAAQIRDYAVAKYSYQAFATTMRAHYEEMFK